MNRLVSPVEDTLTLESLDQNKFSNGSDLTPVTTTSSRSRAPLATFTPIHYERRYAYPLLIWLHGRGGNERQLQELMPLVSLRNYVAVAARGTIRHRSNEQAFAWGQSPRHVEQAGQRLVESIDEAKSRFNVHSGRVFVAGYGCGGTMAVRLAWRFPERFAGAATIGGPIPQGQRPLARINELRKLPLLLSSGRESSGYDEQHVCSDLRLLHSAGLTVAMRQYPCGDELRTNMLTDLDRWMMEIVCGNHGVGQTS